MRPTPCNAELVLCSTLAHRENKPRVQNIRTSGHTASISSRYAKYRRDGSRSLSLMNYIQSCFVFNTCAFGTDLRFLATKNIPVLLVNDAHFWSSSFKLFYGVCRWCLISRPFLHLTPSWQCSSWSFISFIALLMLCIPDDSGLIRFLLSGDIHPIAFLGNRSPILLTCPYLMSWSYWAASTIVTFRPIICSIFRSVFSPFKIFRTICVASPQCCWSSLTFLSPSPYVWSV